jgi:transposase InsO family protein
MILWLSDVPFYRYRGRKSRTPKEKPEVKPTQSNGIWSLDLTYNAFGPLFTYLFTVTDVYSRKIVGWHLGFNAMVESIKQFFDTAPSRGRLIWIAEAPEITAAL